MYATTFGTRLDKRAVLVLQKTKRWTRQGSANTQLTNRSIDPGLSTAKADSICHGFIDSFDFRGVYVGVVSVDFCRTLQFRVSLAASVGPGRVPCH